jgi:hypothetical protein
VTARWRIDFPEHLWADLRKHLFPGDQDEHAAVLAAGVAQGPGMNRLLVRSVFPAVDGLDYVPGTRGYRALTGEFVTGRILHCREGQLAYVAVHCHRGRNHVAFSGDDRASQERGYPALLDIANGLPVGALVLAEKAAAGEIWLPQGGHRSLHAVRVVGRPMREYYSSPPAAPSRQAAVHDRQALLFGDRGQEILGCLKVGIIGVGGVGSLIVEYLARLGVGHILVVDPDRMDPTNLSRVVGSVRRDVLWADRAERWPRWLRRSAARFATPKVRVARRVARSARPQVNFESVFGDFVDDSTARKFADCDYLFLAADTMQCRLVFNAIVQQYLIPGFQVGSKVPFDPATGAVVEPYSVSRPVSPARGCLWCNGLISGATLQEEALSMGERRAQRYLDDPEIPSPSVITMNAVGAAYATNAFMFAVTGLLHPGADLNYRYFEHCSQSVRFDEPRRAQDCLECGTTPRSRAARGDARLLPTRR